MVELSEAKHQKRRVSRR
ncbi:hypothetical protein LINPERPRIM_LOCUS2885 [Linum perenne]